MRQCLGSIGDPALHLIVLTAAAVATATVLYPWSQGPHRGEQRAHPAGCHACSLCPPGAAAALDAYLVRSGTIDPSSETE